VHKQMVWIGTTTGQKLQTIRAKTIGFCLRREPDGQQKRQQLRRRSQKDPSVAGHARPSAAERAVGLPITGFLFYCLLETAIEARLNSQNMARIES